MKQNVVALVLTMISLGCTGNPNSPVSVGFMNQTQHSGTELQTIWTEAQHSVAQNIDLNPVQRLSNNVPQACARVIRARWT